MESQILSEAQEKCNYIAGLVLRFIGPFPPLFTSSTFTPDSSHRLVIIFSCEWQTQSTNGRTESKVESATPSHHPSRLDGEIVFQGFTLPFLFTL